MSTITPDQLREWLIPVEDPEMRVSVIDLGLVYLAEMETDTKARVEMTLTSPNCPVAGMFIDNVKKRLLEYPGVTEAEVKLVFEPKWDPKTMASDEIKERLGIW